MLQTNRLETYIKMQLYLKSLFKFQIIKNTKSYLRQKPHT